MENETIEFLEGRLKFSQKYAEQGDEAGKREVEYYNTAINAIIESIATKELSK